MSWCSRQVARGLELSSGLACERIDDGRYHLAVVEAMQGRSEEAPADAGYRPEWFELFAVRFEEAGRVRS